MGGRSTINNAHLEVGKHHIVNMSNSVNKRYNFFGKTGKVVKF